MDLMKQITDYIPFNEQEEADRRLILECLGQGAHIFNRGSLTAHMSASAWVVNSSRSKALMAYHNIYQSWSWLGGHADGEQDLLQVALREVREESGVKNVRPISDEIFSLEVLTVDGHIKRGAYVPSHLHLNVTYLLEADDRDELFVKADENSGVRWFDLESAAQASSEPWMRERIYQKLYDKLKTYGNK